VTAPPTLHLLLTASMASSPAADPSACAPSDHRCTADANMAASRAATSDSERAHRLYRAHRAYLALARQATPNERGGPLCRAAELLDQVRALQTPESLRRPLADTAKETADALAGAGIVCGPKKPRRAVSRRVVTRPSSATTTAPGQEPASTSGSVPALLEVRADRPAALHEVDRRSSREPEPVSEPQRVPALRPAAQPLTVSSATSTAIAPTDRRWKIGGGVAIAAGMVLGGTAAYLGARASRARQAGIDLAATETGAAAREQGLALQNEYRTAGTVAVAVGIVGGAAILAGLATLVVGHRRSVRARERAVTLMPARSGLVFSVNF